MRTTQVAPEQKHQQQIDQLKAEVDSLRRQLRGAQRLATMGTMTAMVAHEFNNILTPIVNYAQLAKDNPMFADKAITKAVDGGQRASTICKAILGLARGESSDSESINMVELVNQTLAVMVRDPQKDGIEVAIKAPAELTVTAPRTELQQVLLNLLINARAAVMARSGPRNIEIAASQARRFVNIRISDNGVGIPPENLNKIFEPFFSTGKEMGDDSGGSGLGLTICREIMTSLGGEITVESVLGKGTTFTLRLPG